MRTNRISKRRERERGSSICCMVNNILIHRYIIGLLYVYLSNAKTYACMPLDKRKSSHNREAEKLNRISFSSSIRRVFRIALFFLSISRSLSLSPLVRCRLICHTHTHLLDGSAYETLYRVCTSHYRKSRHAKMDNFGFRENRHIDLDFFPFGNMVFVCVLCRCVHVCLICALPHSLRLAHFVRLAFRGADSCSCLSVCMLRCIFMYVVCVCQIDVVHRLCNVFKN